ncbi:MAG: PH domain-containing protein [Patescibacteria group bacterium]
MSMFSFLTQTEYTFEGKKSYESVLLLLHRHWFVLFVQIVGFALMALIPLILSILIGYVRVSLPFAEYYSLLTAIFYLFWWYGLFYTITMYLLDVWIVTDHRVIDSEQHGFFRRTVAELHLSKIQDISVDITGVIPTFLDYGNLEVQTAGTSEKFFFKQIPHPNQVKDIIMEAHNQFIKAHPNDVEIHE